MSKSLSGQYFSSGKDPYVHARLSGMMFLEYFIWGAWYVTMGTYLLNTLKTNGVQVGHAYGTFAISSMISPFLLSFLADRYISPRKLLGILHLIGAILLFAISETFVFGKFYIILLLYTLCYTPTFALTNSITLSHLNVPDKEFSGIRVFGTIGWIIAGLILGYFQLETDVVFFKIAAFASLLLGLYAFSLPKPKNAFLKKDLIKSKAFDLFKQKDFLIFIVSSFLLCTALMFFYSFTNPYLNEIGMQNAAGKMTLGQASELLIMLILPWFFRRLGIKKMLMIGMLAWGARFLLFAFGNNSNLLWMLYLGILLHGFCFDFFFVTGQIFMDKKAPGHLRNSAQGLFTFITYGLGFYAGSWMAGLVVEHFKQHDVSHCWLHIWMVPAAITFAVFLLFASLFKTNQKDRTPNMPTQNIKI